MNHWLYLSPQRAVEGAGFDTVWCGGDDVPAHVCTLVEAGQLLQGKPVQVILPMEVCSWLRSPPWPSRRTPGSQALGYAVEDQLGEDVDGLHVALGKPDAERRYPLLIIARTRLRELLEVLHSAGIRPEKIGADADMLAGEHAVGMRSEGRCLLGGGLEARLALSEQGLTLLRPHLPADIHWQDVETSQLPALLMKGRDRSINLLQGEFRIAQRQWRWGPVCMALACLSVMFWSFALARIHHLESRADQVYAQSLQRFQTLYPEQTRIVDLPAQLKALQARGGEPHAPMRALLTLGERVIGDGIEVHRMAFKDAEGWTLMITAASFEALERLRNKAEQHTLPIRLDSVSKDGEGVNAVLVMREVAQ